MPTINKWSTEEHCAFLRGMRVHGRGSWVNIAKYMRTRTATQVASHAQKHFISLARPRHSVSQQSLFITVSHPTARKFNTLVAHKSWAARLLPLANGATFAPTRLPWARTAFQPV